MIESSNGVQYLIRNETIVVFKENNMKRHYETRHFQNYSKYPGSLKIEKFEALNHELKLQQFSFTKVNNQQEAATRSSHRVAV